VSRQETLQTTADNGYDGKLPMLVKMPGTLLRRHLVYNSFMNNLIKKNLGKITVVLLLLWGIGMAFGLPQIAAAGFFCAVIVPTANVTLGKKYAIPMAVVGVVWLVISIFIM